MCRLVKNIFENLKRYSFSKHSGTSDTVKADLTFSPLTPTDEAKDCESYMGALSWALNQDKIHNIAISGPYGSGKSSVIRTFLSPHGQQSKYKHLTISLATFNVQKDGNNQELQSRLIESSILEQLFYHEEDSHIPDSRFKKIRKQHRGKLFFYAIYAAIYCLLLTFLFKPTLLTDWIWGQQLPAGFEIWFNRIALALCLIGATYVLYKLARIIIGLSVKRLNFKSAEVEIENNTQKSVLNSHIDEIIYFFEVTKYQIVVLEDLDRFDNQDIFIKLREINYIINNSDKVKQKVVFIYAIKDDMFVDKDRTKFFDFIIPIIPVINYSNSGEILRNDPYITKQKIEPKLIDNLSLFIDDLRLLHNIINEFIIYSQKTDANLPDKNGLLAIIAYKNLYPKDFTLLNHNEGLLYKIINDKQTYISNALEQQEQKILEIQKEIETIENSERPLSLKELRTVYLYQILKHITPPSYFTGFNIDNNKHSLQECVENDALFEAIVEKPIQYYGYRTNYGRDISHNLNISFQEIEREVNPKLTYKQRASMLNVTELENLRQKLEQYRAAKEAISSQTLQELLNGKDADKIIDKSQYKAEQETQFNCISILIRDGYIKENYWDYISIFHEGSLTLTDKQFLVNVKLHKPTVDYSHKLQRVDNLIKQIPANDFGKPYILNNYLVDFILSDAYVMVDETGEKKNKLFSLLTSNKIVSTQFVVQYLERYQHIDEFLTELCSRIHSVWKILSKYFKGEKLEDYFQRIIKNCSTEDIIHQFYMNEAYIENYPNFMLMECEKNKLKEIVDKLDVKFVTLSKQTSKEDIQYIYDRHYYALKPDIMQFVLSVVLEGWNNHAFYTQNYSYIRINAPQTAKYIQSNLLAYIDNVYLVLDSQQTIESAHLVELLNNETLPLEKKKQIINKSECKVENIEDIADALLRNDLCKQNKMEATWENIRIMMNEDEESENACVEFINIIENAQQLASKAPQKEEQTPDDDNLFYNLVCRNDIHDEAYALLVPHVNFNCPDFEEDEISENHMRILIENNIITSSGEGFRYLKEKHPNLRITLLEKTAKDHEWKYSECQFDAEDIMLIVQSAKLDDATKQAMINSISSTDVIADNIGAIKLVVEWLLSGERNEDAALKKEIMNYLIQQPSIDASTRKQLFIKFANVITDIEPFLKSLGKPYSDLAERKEITYISTEDKELLDALKRVGYITEYRYTPGNRKYYIRDEYIK